MIAVTELTTKAKKLIAEVEAFVALAENDIDGAGQRVLARLDTGQLGLAVHRLELFGDHISDIRSDEDLKEAEPKADEKPVKRRSKAA